MILFQTVSSNDFCHTIFGTVLENGLVNKGSRASQWLGFYVTSLSKLEIAGILDMSFVTMLTLFITFEMLFTICLNIDMIYTLTNPFKRTQVLAYLNTFIRISSILVVILQGVAIQAFVAAAA